MVRKLLPNRVRRTYLGGGRIDAFCGTHVVSGPQPLPEDWLASTTTAFNGRVEIAGEGLGCLEDGRAVRDVVGELPILVKLLDSDERLVIQAHPTVTYAREHFNSPVGKTECWYFLPGTAPDACVYLGFKPGVTRKRWQAAFRAQNGLLDFLHRVPVQAGDFVFVDGGVPHAIGGGCFLIELQEPSDLMVVAERVTPSGREIPDRKMHGGLGWEEMFNVYAYDGVEAETLYARYVRRQAHGRIVGPDLTDKFAMQLLAGGDRCRLAGVPAVAVVVSGEGALNGVPVRRGDRFLVAGEDEVRMEGTVAAVVSFKG